ncbi:MAG: hypothetical protein WCW14_02990 [Candidatus Paceibacterota bacterium]
MNRRNVREVHGNDWLTYFKYRPIILKTGHFPVRNLSERRQWHKRFGMRPIVALYNNGSQLYADPFNLPATSHYATPWFHIRYNEFSDGALLRLPRNELFIRTRGHDQSGVVTVNLGWGKKRFSIPPLCILYIASTAGCVRDVFLQYQPLPCKIVPKLLVF